MLRYLVRRLLLLLPVLLGVSFLTFALMRIIPGDIVTNMMGVTAANNPVTRARILHELGLDRSLMAQYVWWLGRIAHGDLGYSFVHGGPVLGEIMRCLPVTLEVCVLAMLIAILIGVPLGVLAAVQAGRPLDYIARFVALLGISTPNFFIGALVVVFGAIYFPQMQTLGYVPFATDPLGNLERMIWPALTLGLGVASILIRYARSSMLEVLGEDYVRTAEAKGLSRFAVIGVHALKNAMIPVITAAGVWSAFLIGGTVLIEQIFAMPGLGRLVLSAIQSRDYPVIQGTVLFLSFSVAIIMLVADLLVATVDPRVTLS